MEEIKLWIDNPEKTLDGGISLYNKYGKNPNLKKFLSRALQNPSAANQKVALEKVQYELAKISGVSANVVPPTATTAPIAGDTGGNANPLVVDSSKSPIFVDSEIIDISLLPEDLKAKYLAIKEGYKTISSLHTQMQNPELSEDERAKILADLINTDESINAYWEEIKAFSTIKPEVKKSEIIPESLYPLVQSCINAYKRLSVCRDNISRANKEIQDLKDDKKIAKKKESIAKWESEIDECNQLLAGIQL